MAESHHERQLRLMREHECARLFTELRQRFLADVTPLTLLTFDYAGGAFCSVEYKTTLPIDVLAPSVELQILALKHGPARDVDLSVVDRLKLPNQESMREISRWLKAKLSPGRGFVLLIGIGDACQYGATANRQDVVELLETECLPNWWKGIRSDE